MVINNINDPIEIYITFREIRIKKVKIYHIIQQKLKA